MRPALDVAVTVLQVLSGRYRLVGGICGQMEWGVVPVPDPRIASGRSSIRCFRVMGMWCLAQGQLVPMRVGPQS